MKTHHIFLISLVVFIVLFFVLPVGFISLDPGNVILIISTFMFGVIAGFILLLPLPITIASNLLLANETAALIFLYQNVLIYDKKSAEKLSLLIDEYVWNALNYEIIDYIRNPHFQFKKI